MRVNVSQKERAIVLVDGKPEMYLYPGRYRLWVAPWRDVELKCFTFGALPARLGTDELAMVPTSDWQLLALPESLRWRRIPGRTPPWTVQLWPPVARESAPAVAVELIEGDEAMPSA